MVGQHDLASAGVAGAAPTTQGAVWNLVSRQEAAHTGHVRSGISCSLAAINAIIGMFLIKMTPGQERARQSQHAVPRSGCYSMHGQLVPQCFEVLLLLGCQLLACTEHPAVELLQVSACMVLQGRRFWDIGGSSSLEADSALGPRASKLTRTLQGD